MTDYIALARACGAMVTYWESIDGHSVGFDCTSWAAFAARIAQAAPSQDREALIALAEKHQAKVYSLEGEVCFFRANFYDFCAAIARAALSVAPSQNREDAALAYLDGLSDDAAAHIWPEDLDKCIRTECVVQVHSVRMTRPGGSRTVPLFSRPQVVDALAARQAPKEPK